MVQGDTGSLEMDCVVDDLSPIQLEAYEKAEKEHNEIRQKLNVILRGSNSENLFSGNIFSAYQLTGLVTGLESYTKAPNIIRSQNRKIVKNLRDQSKTYAISDDDIEEVPLANRLPQPAKRQRVSNSRAAPTPPAKQPPQQQQPVHANPIPIPKSSGPQAKPSEGQSLGGLSVGTKAKQVVVRIGIDSQEVNFSKLQGKTFPSLVVFVRPTLIPRDKFPNDRPSLDAKVKTILMYTPSKFAEWLIQQGLVRSEQTCITDGVALKLGIYSDVSRFPFSGGYVWISQCCSGAFYSIFYGSIFEASCQNPAILLKLIYHWSCQTNVQNVVQWVKVDNLFIKEFYTSLRGICTATLYTHSSICGGPGRKIEVGVISLGTSSADGAQRQVKVEVLGIYDPQTKQIRLRAVEPLPYTEKVYRKRFLKILEPLVDWVHEDSIILTDLTVDKATLHNYGFKNVIQSNPADVGKNPRMVANSNVTIMDYLRRVVPRMFQNTLSLLNRQIIQQFLDELVWREIFGNTPNGTFDNMLAHIAEQTRLNTKDRLVQRLSKMAANPFRNWSHLGTSLNQAQKGPAPPQPLVSPVRAALTAAAASNKRKRSPPRQTAKPLKPLPKQMVVTLPKSLKAPPPRKSDPPVKKAPPPAVQKHTTATNSVESYYFGIYNPRNQVRKDSGVEVVFEVKCPECELTFVTNLELQDHLCDHLLGSPLKYQCRYCFDRTQTHEALVKHIMASHPFEARTGAGQCYDLICESAYENKPDFGAHMREQHYPSELPYRCGVCAFRSSSRRITIDHFYEEHGKSAALMCMMCLQVVVCANRQQGVLYDNVNAFLAHLKQHKHSQGVHSCTHCVLQFFSAGRLRAHLYTDHVSMAGADLEPIGKTTTTIAAPARPAKPLDLTTVVKIVESAKRLTLDVPNGQMCLECDQDFDAPNHIMGLIKCPKCWSKTYCLVAALEHTSTCSLPIVRRPLERAYHCVCKFTSDDGNALAKHMINCGKSSVYPSAEAAEGNLASMLDQLGLMRRDGGEAAEETPTTLEGLVMELGETATVVETQTVEEEHVVQIEGENESYLDSTYDANLSLADLAPPPPSASSVIVSHVPRDEYKDLATPHPHVSEDAHMMDYGHPEEEVVIEQVEVPADEMQTVQEEYQNY